MSYVLQTSGLATVASSIIMVDSDGTTIRDFTNPTRTAAFTIDAAVTTGMTTWKSTAVSYFQTLANGAYGFKGITIGSGNEIVLPNQSGGTGSCVFIAYAGADTPSASTDPAILASAGGVVLEIKSSNLTWVYGGGGTGATTIPSNLTTKFSIAANFTYGGAKSYYYGLESGSLALDATFTDGGYGSSASVNQIGGMTGQGNAPGKFNIIATFPRPLTLSEAQSLHNGYISVLFQTGGGGGSALRRNSGNLSGLGSPGPFFQNPLQ